MQQLADAQCVACQPGEPQVSEAEIATLRAQIPDWQIVERGGMRRLERVFTFDTFVEALAFTITIGALAEVEGHHPAILTEWGKVTVTWWTHAIGGLHHNDFVMAAKTDAAYAKMAAA